MDKITLREAFKSLEDITDEIFDAFAQPEVKVVNKRKLNESLKEYIDSERNIKGGKLADALKSVGNGFDISDTIFDWGEYFDAYEDLQGSDAYSKVMKLFADNIDFVEYKEDWYSPCKVAEFIEKNIDKFNQFLNVAYISEYQPQNFEKQYTINDEEFYDIYMEMMSHLLRGNFAEEDYQTLLDIFKGKKITENLKESENEDNLYYYIDFENDSPFSDIDKLAEAARKYNLQIEEHFKYYGRSECWEWWIIGQLEDLKQFISKYFNYDQVEYIYKYKNNKNESLKEANDDYDDFNPFKNIVKELKGNKLDTPMKKEMTLDFAKLIANRIKENEGSFNASDDEYEVLNSICYSIDDYEPSPTLLSRYTRLLTGYSLSKDELNQLLELLWNEDDDEDFDESLKEDINYNKELRDAYIALDDANIRFNVDKNVFEFYTSTDANKAEQILIDIFGDDYVYNRGFDVVVYLDEYLSKDEDEDDEDFDESLKEDKLTEDGKNINLKKYGFVRAPEEDFTDDGNRFTCYYYDPEHNGDKRFILSKLVDRGDVYISVHYTSPESRRTKYFDDLNGVGVDTVINGGLEKLVKDIEEFKKGIDEFNKVTRLNDEQVKQLADEIKVLMDRAGLEKYAAIKRAYHNLGIEYDTVPYEEKQKLDNYLRNTEPYNKEKLLQDVKEMIKDVIKEMTYYSTNYNRQYNYHNPKSPEEAIKAVRWHISRYPDAVQQRVIDHILKHLSTLYDFKDESYNRKLKEAISMKVVDKMAQEIVDELEEEGLIESCKKRNIKESRLVEEPIYTRPQEPIKPDTKDYYKRELKDIAWFFNKVFGHYIAVGFINCPKVTIEDIFNVYSPNFEHNNPANDNKTASELTGANFYDRAINYLQQFENWDDYVEFVSDTIEDDIDLEDAIDEGYLISKKDFNTLLNNDERAEEFIKVLINNHYYINDEENFVFADKDKKNYKGVKYVVSVYGDGVHYYDPTDDICVSPDIEDAKKYNSKEDIDIIDIVADVVNANKSYLHDNELADIFDCNSLEELDKKIENDDADFFINNGTIKIIPVIGNREIEESYKRSLKESEKIDIQDDEEIEKGKEILDNNKKADTDSETMKVVDVDAETVDKLKDSYIGNVLLQCPVCRTPIFKKPDLLTQDEENEELYNVGEQCPHCGSEDGFELVGQVASMDVETEEEDKETTGKQEVETEDNFEQTVEDEDNEETIETEDEEVTFESLDIDRFNNIANTYLTEVYSNVDSFTTTNATVDDKNNKLVIEGIIKYKSGKSKNTKFEFLGESIKNGKYIFKGLNETFAKNNKKAFTLTADIKNNTLISESLGYNYTVINKKLNESKIVKGSTFKKKLIERIVYEVHSDVDENNVFNQFEGKGARKQAIDYAKKNGNCWVEKHWYEKDEDFDTQDPEEIWNYLDESKVVKGNKSLKEGKYTDYNDDHFGVLVYKYVNDDEEHTEEYDDPDDIRTDFIRMTQDEKDDYEYVVMQEVTIDDDGTENIKEVDSYYKE